MSAPLIEFADAVVRLRATIAEASEAQWGPSHTPSPREDTTERAKGGHGDPTSSTVMDDRRLALRERVQEAERVLASAAAYCTDVDRKLQAALDAWAGDRGYGV